MPQANNSSVSPTATPSLQRTSFIPTKKPTSIPTTAPTNIPTIIPTTFFLPTSINYFYYNGKYFSTLANVNLNGPPNNCQSNYIYLPANWILAPGNSDSIKVINLNTWSTTTVVVASGVGYYSSTIYGSINSAYSNWLYSTSSPYYGNAYSCKLCNCQILIMYSPVSNPSYSPVVSSTAKKSSSSSGGSALYSLIVLPFLILAGCLYYFLRYRRRLSAVQMQPIQMQPVPHPTNSTGHFEQPPISTHNYGIIAQPQPMVYDKNMQQPQPQQPYMHTQQGYIELQSQQTNQPQGYGYGQSQLQPQPQGYQSQLQPQPQGYQSQLQPQPQGYQSQLQPQPQGYQSQLQPQPQGYGYGQPQHQNGHSPAQLQQLSGAADYYNTQPRPYSPAVEYPATVEAVSMYDGHVPPANY